MKRTIMQKHIWMLAALVLLSQVFLSPLTATDAQARTQVTVTFAAGGVVCGIFILLRFAVSSSLLPNASYDNSALFNKGHEGWNVAIPSLTATSLNKPDMRRSEPAGDRVEMELLKIRF